MANSTDKHEFTLEKRGYSPAEVDLFIDDITSKYNYLQAQNAILSAQLAEAQRMNRRFANMEKDLRQNIADSKRAAAAMLTETSRRSEILLDDARARCGLIIADMDAKIAERQSTLETLKKSVAQFKNRLYDLYSAHIEQIDEMAEAVEAFSYEPELTTLAEAIDVFETSGETPELPDFEEYPEESIFNDMDQAEKNTFAMDSATAPDNEAEPEAAAELVFGEHSAYTTHEEAPAEESDFMTETDAAEAQLYIDELLSMPEYATTEQPENDETASLTYISEEDSAVKLPEEPVATSEDSLFFTPADAEYTALNTLFTEGEAEEISVSDEIFGAQTKDENNEINEVDYFQFLNDFANGDNNT